MQAVDSLESPQPDVLLLDPVVVKMNGLQVARQVCRSSPETSVIPSLCTMSNPCALGTADRRKGLRIEVIHLGSVSAFGEVARILLCVYTRCGSPDT